MNICSACNKEYPQYSERGRKDRWCSEKCRKTLIDRRYKRNKIRKGDYKNFRIETIEKLGFTFLFKSKSLFPSVQCGRFSKNFSYLINDNSLSVRKRTRLENIPSENLPVCVSRTSKPSDSQIPNNSQMGEKN